MSIRWKESATNALLVLVSLTVFLACGDAVFRRLHVFGARISWIAPDPLLGYRCIPGQYWVFEESDHPIQIRFNRYGWRGEDWSPGKRTGILRLAVLGDSFVEAAQVEEQGTFLKLVEEDLSKSYGTQAELLNFGRSGYGPTEELIVLQNEVQKFQPDWVVLFFFPGNDISDVCHEANGLGTTLFSDCG